MENAEEVNLPEQQPPQQPNHVQAVSLKLPPYWRNTSHTVSQKCHLVKHYLLGFYGILCSCTTLS